MNRLFKRKWNNDKTEFFDVTVVIYGPDLEMFLEDLMNWSEHLYMVEPQKKVGTIVCRGFVPEKEANNIQRLVELDPATYEMTVKGGDILKFRHFRKIGKNGYLE